LGVEVVVSDPTADAPASPVVRDQLVGGFDDRDTLMELAERSDFLTFEIELVDPDVLKEVSEASGVPVHPAPDTLRTIQDKLVQKKRLRNAGVSVPEFRGVNSAEEVREALDELGYPGMLKARQGGYDGRGNVLIESPQEVEDAFDSISGPAMVEEVVEFERELAVMGCIGAEGTDCFPVTETVHEEEILRSTVSPPRADEERCREARGVANRVLEVMEGRGVYGIELFDTGEDILLNEIAPRPHNSGHWTIEGCQTSQFEQHVRAVTGQPLGSTERRSSTATANLLGDVDERGRAELHGDRQVLETPRAHLHWYGKREVYHLRKMGHITVVGKKDDATTQVLDSVRNLRDECSFEVI
ncbi:MAG: 5-(carboxyamino)imidazole ribonucleotide synthase, partial [Halobacteria archaeon]|nr:5-(carboxyamino)imidazole ribonucleotide synthase [Halobacteria archaeon]